MRLFSLFLVAMASLAIASPVAVDASAVDVKSDIFARDLNVIVDTIHDINKKVDRLQAALKEAKRGKFWTALSVLNRTGKVHKALAAGTEVVRQQPPLNVQDSTTVAKVVLEEVKPRITALADALIEKKRAFQKVFLIFGDFTGTVEKKIRKSKKLSNEFANTLVAKLDPSFADAGANVTVFIADEFDRALADYEKKKKTKKQE